MAKDYHCKPSDLLSIRSPILAYYLDRAVYIFCQRLQQELDNVANKKSRSEAQQVMARGHILKRWLGLNETVAPPRRH